MQVNRPAGEALSPSGSHTQDPAPSTADSQLLHVGTQTCQLEYVEEACRRSATALIQEKCSESSVQVRAPSEEVSKVVWAGELGGNAKNAAAHQPHARLKAYPEDLVDAKGAGKLGDAG